MLLKDVIYGKDGILLKCHKNFSDKRKDILKKFSKDERLINYYNLFFKSGLISVENLDFFKRFGTLYDLLIDLLNEKMSINEVIFDQNRMGNKINNLLKILTIENEKTIFKEKHAFTVEKRVLTNSKKLYDKRNIIINAFGTNCYSWKLKN